MQTDSHLCYLSEEKAGDESEFSGEENRNKLAYCVTDVPPWYLCIILGIQVPTLPPTLPSRALPCPVLIYPALSRSALS